MRAAPLLEVEGLGHRFGAVQALSGIHFCVEAGESVAVIGPNGAGKSTLFDLIGGQKRLQQGQLRLGGRAMGRASVHRRWQLGLGRSFQIVDPFLSFNVREALQLVLELRECRPSPWRWLPRHHRESSAQLLAEFGIADLAERPCATLAYGDLKQVELALVLAQRPRLLLLDEPTAGMAPGERHSLMAHIHRLCRQRQVALLFTEHDMDAVFAHAERLLVLDQGQLIAAGSPQQVRENPTVRERYLGEAQPPC